MTETLKLDLAAEVLASFGQARLPVTGTSMFPCIRPGDLLEVRQAADPIRPGEVVVFERHGRLVAHRVVESSGDLVVTRGDRLKFPDSPVPADAILGRVSAVQHRGRRVAPHSTRFTRVVSALLRHSEFATRIALYSARMIRP